MQPLVFRDVWYRPEPNTWERLELAAMRDSGVLTVRGAELDYRGGKGSLAIRHITHISLGQQGRDFINTWVKVEYLENDQPLVAYFSDGTALGWGGVLGGTKAMYAAIEQSLRAAYNDPPR